MHEWHSLQQISLPFLFSFDILREGGSVWPFIACVIWLHMAVKDQHSWNSCAFNDFCVFNGSCWGSSGCRTGRTCVSPLTMRACWLMLQQISSSVDCGSDRGALRWLRPPSSSEPVLSQFPTSPSKKFAFLYSINMNDSSASPEYKNSHQAPGL